MYTEKMVMLGKFKLYVFYHYFKEMSLLVGKKNESMIPPNKRAHSSLREKKWGTDCRASRRWWKAVSWWGSGEDETWDSSQAGMAETVSGKALAHLLLRAEFAGGKRLW